MKSIKYLLSVLLLMFLSGCSLTQQSYVEIKSANKPLNVLDISVENYESLVGTWLSEVGDGEHQTILTIDKKGIVKVFNADKKLQNQGELVVANDDTFDKGYIAMNIKGKYEGKERNIYASGHMSSEREYSKFDKNLYLIQRNSEFRRDEVGFDYTRENEWAIRQDIPTKITKDTLIFQENEKDIDKGYGIPNAVHYLVFHRKDEMNKKQTFEKSTVNDLEIRDDNFSSISGNWKSRDGYSLKVYSDGRADVIYGGVFSKGIIEISSNDPISGDLGLKTEQWAIPIYANGGLGREVDAVDGNNFQIRKSGEIVGGTKATVLYSIFEVPDGVPRLSVIDRDILMLTEHHDENFNSPEVVYFRENNMKEFSKVKDKNGMNIDELARGDYSSIAGTWGLPNNQGLATRVRIDSDGTMYWDNSTTSGQTIHDVVKNSDGSGLGVMGAEYDRQSAPTGSYVNFFPAGVVVKGGEDSDSSKDRIAFGGTVTNYNDPYVFYRLDE